RRDDAAARALPAARRGGSPHPALGRVDGPAGLRLSLFGARFASVLSWLGARFASALSWLGARFASALSWLGARFASARAELRGPPDPSALPVPGVARAGNAPLGVPRAAVILRQPGPG